MKALPSLIVSLAWLGSSASHAGLQIKDDGTLWAWGWNGFGQLGLPDTLNQRVPVQVGTNKWIMVSGSGHTLGIKEDGTLWAWGRNRNGQLGLGDRIDRNAPTQVDEDSWMLVSAGGSGHSLGIKTDGTLWAWGWNGFGQLGLGDFLDRSVPTQVGRDRWMMVTASAHSLAIQNGGSLWAWGANSYGQLGLGDQSNRNTPTQVGSHQWRMVSAGLYHSLAIRRDGSLWSWGNNRYGELGLGDQLDQQLPTRIGNDYWIVAHAYSSHCLGIAENGTLWAWGWNAFGQLGLADFSNRNLPTQVGSEDRWFTVSNPESSGSFAVKTDGAFWAWGANSEGQLGLGDLRETNVPQQVSAFRTLKRDQVLEFPSIILAFGHDAQFGASLWHGTPVWNAFGRGTLEAASLSTAYQNEIKTSVRGMLRRSDVNLEVKHGPPSVGHANIYFSDHFGSEYRGGKARGVDQFDRNDTGEAAVFWNFDELPDASEIAAIVAHEAGHLYGLRHVDPPEAVDPRGESIMDYNCAVGESVSTSRFINSITERMEFRRPGPEDPNPSCFVGVPQVSTHNPLYHLKRWVERKSPRELELAGIAPGDWDLKLWERIVANFSFHPDTDLMLYDLRIFAGLDACCDAEEIAHFPEISTNELSLIDFSLEVGQALAIVASTTSNGKESIVFSENMPTDNHISTFDVSKSKSVKIYYTPATGGSPQVIATATVTTTPYLPEPEDLCISRVGLSLLFKFRSVPGLSYHVERSPDLQGPWTRVSNSILGDNEVKEMGYSNVGDERVSEFFRVRILRPK
ncbi:MAG TPA: hypothetical protein VMN36_15020 [Verrucomicrobiales bacterium]|nr:hypothetical protein [Verrucomicrobiales bacterium]